MGFLSCPHLAAFAGDDSIVDSWGLVPADLTGDDLDLSCRDNNEERLILLLTAEWKKKNCFKFNLKVNTCSQLQFLHCSYYGFLPKIYKHQLFCLYLAWTHLQTGDYKQKLCPIIIVIVVVSGSSIILNIFYIFSSSVTLFRLFSLVCLGMCKKNKTKTTHFFLWFCSVALYIRLYLVWALWAHTSFSKIL